MSASNFVCRPMRVIMKEHVGNETIDLVSLYTIKTLLSGICSLLTELNKCARDNLIRLMKIIYQTVDRLMIRK